MNGEICADLAKEGGACTHILTDDARMIDGPTWEALAVGPDHRFGKVCVDSKVLANWVASITKLCGWSRMCSYQDKAALRSMKVKLNNLQTQLALKEQSK